MPIGMLKKKDGINPKCINETKIIYILPKSFLIKNFNSIDKIFLS